MRPRPVEHLEAVSRQFPGVWQVYDRLLAERSPDWPSWCLIPRSNPYRILNRTWPYLGPAHLETALPMTRIQALAAWRLTQGIYRFDDTLLQELLATPFTGVLPEHLFRLPEWCVYIELPENDELHGFFAYVDWCHYRAEPELRLLLDYADILLPVVIPLTGNTIAEGLTRRICTETAAFPNISDVRRSQLPGTIEMAQQLVSVLLYVCSPEPEFRATRGAKRPPGVLPGRPGRAAPSNGRYRPARGLEIWETGFDLGRALRESRRSDPTGRTVRGHLRRAHWHSFWVGTGENRHLDVRWLPVSRVKLGLGPGPGIVTRRNVKLSERGGANSAA